VGDRVSLRVKCCCNRAKRCAVDFHVQRLLNGGLLCLNRREEREPAGFEPRLQSKNSSPKTIVSGRAQRAPGRFKDRREPYSPPLGDPPEYVIDPLQRAAWNDYRREIPWLCEAHGGLVLIASLLRARLARGEATTKAMNLLRLCVTSMDGAATSDIGNPDDVLFTRCV
jgi:hypothetical protein